MLLSVIYCSNVPIMLLSYMHELFYLHCKGLYTILHHDYANKKRRTGYQLIKQFFFIMYFLIPTEPYCQYVDISCYYFTLSLFAVPLYKFQSPFHHLILSIQIMGERKEKS